MSERYLYGAFAFSCMSAEAALIQEAWQIVAILKTGTTPPAPGPTLTSILPPTKVGDPFSGLTALFDDPDRLDFGAELDLETEPHDPGRCRVTLHGLKAVQPVPLADLIRICCQATLRRAPIEFVWSRGADRPILGRFGAGWAAIFPHRIDFGWASEAIAPVLDAEMLDRGTLDMWLEDPDRPFADWQADVINFDTRLGYLDWVIARREAAAIDGVPPQSA